MSNIDDMFYFQESGNGRMAIKSRRRTFARSIRLGIGCEEPQAWKQRGDRLLLPRHTQGRKNLPNNRNYFIIDVNKGGVRFRNSALEEINQVYLKAQRENEEQQQSVVNEILNVVGNLDWICLLSNYYIFFLRGISWAIVPLKSSAL